MNRVNKITDEVLKKHERPWIRDWGPGNPEVQTFGYSKEQIKRSLNAARDICNWAIDHGYKRVYLA